MKNGMTIIDADGHAVDNEQRHLGRIEAQDLLGEPAAVLQGRGLSAARYSRSGRS